MSIANLGQFNRNLIKMMKSPAFKGADNAKQLNMGYRLINSKHGNGAVLKIENNEK